MEAPGGDDPGSLGRGRLLLEYRPPRAHPIVYAALLLFVVVFVTGSLENLARDAERAVYAAYALPLLAALLYYVAAFPSDIRIHERGIAPSRPLVARWHRPFLAWDDVAAVYPSFYDVTGAFVSPFASSDGKVTQMGLAIEGRDGRTETVRFTPTRFSMWQPESQGYKEALAAVQHAWGDRPLVGEARTYDPDEAERMVAEARKPFLPFFAIVALVASPAVLLWLLTRTLDMAVAPALALSILPMLGVMLQSFLRARRRNRILNRLSKAAAYRRGLEAP